MALLSMVGHRVVMFKKISYKCHFKRMHNSLSYEWTQVRSKYTACFPLINCPTPTPSVYMTLFTIFIILESCHRCRIIGSMPIKKISLTYNINSPTGKKISSQNTSGKIIPKFKRPTVYLEKVSSMAHGCATEYCKVTAVLHITALYKHSALYLH